MRSGCDVQEHDPAGLLQLLQRAPECGAPTRSGPDDVDHRQHRRPDPPFHHALGEEGSHGPAKRDLRHHAADLPRPGRTVAGLHRAGDRPHHSLHHGRHHRHESGGIGLKRIILAAATLSLLAGCAVGPDYRRPELGTEVPAGWSAHDSTAVRTSLALQAGSGRDGRWWTGFHDATLDSLVERALAHNPDLQAAAARVLEARALAGGARADRWPSIEVGGTASRSKSANLNFPGFVSPHLTSFSASATARYEADLWGRVARGDEAAVASLLASDHERAALARSIVAAVINARFETLELSGRTQLTEATLTSYRQTLEAVEDRYRQGLVPSLDFELARQNLL
ncbi:hypothetical protein COW53_07000, partial [bacterium CG17_big_fil_post_rev_8_21_14_2_50_64_8]